MIEVALLTLGALLAYANGANDVSKGIATLVGSGVADYRRAILWGALWTGVGGMAASFAAGAMLATFGHGTLAPGVTPSLTAAAAALLGAAAWVLLATRWNLPVSTTHALVGALAGAAVAAYGVAGVAWSGLGARVALPLIASPVAAFVLTRLALEALSRDRLGRAPVDTCVCVDVGPLAVVSLTGANATMQSTLVVPGLAVRTGSIAECRITRQQALRLTTVHLHWLSSGTVSLARGLNDAPKIVALLLGALALAPTAVAPSTAVLFACITGGMVAGSVLAGTRVTRVLAEDVTRMNHWEGPAANVVTTALVTTGAIYGLPMSTTHVSSAGIVGIGAHRRGLHSKTARHIVLAWIVTLPVAALLAALAYGTGRLLWP